MVDRSGKGLAVDFRVMVIEVPDTLVAEKITIETLPVNWFNFQQYDGCQRIGGEWLRNGQSAVPKGPSTIIPNEWSYLLNPAYPEFYQIKLLHSELFAFDPRSKR